jgi:hypothetical protein
MTKTKTKTTIGSFLKDSSPKNQTNIPSKSFLFLNAIDEHLKRKHIRSSILQNMDDQQTMFRASALFTGSINIFSVDLVIDMCSKNTLSL